MGVAGGPVMRVGGGPVMRVGGGPVMRVGGRTGRTGGGRRGRAQTRRRARGGQAWHQDQRRHDHAANALPPHSHGSHHTAMRTMAQLAGNGPTSFQIHRYEGVGIPRVEPTVGQGGIGAHDAAKNLGAREHLEFVA